MLLFTEMSDAALEEYAKERCDEIKKLYDNLKESMIRLSCIKNEIEKIDLMYDILTQINELSSEHIDTLDRYLLAYESDKRLTNVITKLTHDAES